MKSRPSIQTGKNHSSRNAISILTRTFLVAGFLLYVASVIAQSVPQPVLAITSVASNQMTINITNGVSTGNYELYWTPVLGNSAYPWTAAVIGYQGQTNFTVDIATYPTGFYQALVDTNAIPLWQAADPNNPGAGILTITIDSPTNNAVLN